MWQPVKQWEYLNNTTLVLLLYGFEENLILCLIGFIMINEFFKPKSMFFVLTIEFTFLSGFKIYCKVCKMRICNLKGNYTAVVK